jgi:hypothetical protein
MPDKNPIPDSADELRLAERAIVLQLLRDDHPERWTRAELLEWVPDIHPATVDAELLRLARTGTVLIDGGCVKASPCARCLDALDLIGV